jgi:hypothetical protein
MYERYAKSKREQEELKPFCLKNIILARFALKATGLRNVATEPHENKFIG